MSRLYLSFRQSDVEIAREIAHRWRIKNGPYSVVTQPLKNKPDELSLAQHIETMMLHVGQIWLVVGPQWAGIDEFGRYRLSTADVPIHDEVMQALGSGRPVTIILVNGAEQLPSPDRVPEDMHGIYDVETFVLREPQDMDALLARPNILDWIKYILNMGQLVPSNRR
ncbi:hypothetical protein G4Y79_02425 [Phototrophicus methaneseepsis]|uniref:TIR domain-containing protein n=1 Tax=Phototrophicus methaneseepsis TaxID=2710758 RepID=A0A7S8EAA9_9CHLR|nr:hypothetical protein [Phototrophicus methaneseepsis]QPC83252.1 hypothetical protein G4Y79_02425 [Phototrophicus methaneseepsis]